MASTSSSPKTQPPITAWEVLKDLDHEPQPLLYHSPYSLWPQGFHPYNVWESAREDMIRAHGLKGVLRNVEMGTLFGNPFQDHEDEADAAFFQATDRWGNTAVHRAIFDPDPQKALAMVHALVTRWGLSVDVVNRLGERPLDLAEDRWTFDQQNPLRDHVLRSAMLVNFLRSLTPNTTADRVPLLIGALRPHARVRLLRDMVLYGEVEAVEQMLNAGDSPHGLMLHAPLPVVHVLLSHGADIDEMIETPPENRSSGWDANNNEWLPDGLFGKTVSALQRWVVDPYGLKMVQALLNLGANPNVPPKKLPYYSLLGSALSACTNNNHEGLLPHEHETFAAVRALLSHGAKVWSPDDAHPDTHRDMLNTTDMMLAVRLLDLPLDLLDTLLVNGGQAVLDKPRVSLERSNIFVNAVTGQPWAVVERLLAAGAPLEGDEPSNRTPLAVAVILGLNDKAENLLSRGASLPLAIASERWQKAKNMVGNAREEHKLKVRARLQPYEQRQEALDLRAALADVEVPSPVSPARRARL